MVKTSRKILETRIMGTAANFYYFPGNRNFEGFYSWTIKRFWRF